MTTETKMSADEVLATIARHRDTHESLGVVDAYSAQEYPRLRDAHAAVAALIARVEELEAEHAEDQGVIAVWRRRYEQAELDARRYRWLRQNCTHGRMESFYGTFSLNCDEPESEWDAAIDAARAEAGHG